MTNQVTTTARLGRPRLVSDSRERLYCAGNAMLSRRAVLDRHYEVLALETIAPGGEAPADLRWLLEPRLRRSVLAQLGRIPDLATRLAEARRICAVKPTAGDAVAMVRRARCGAASHRQGALTAALVRTLNSYARRHPSLTLQGMRGEVETVLRKVDRAIADARPL